MKKMISFLLIVTVFSFSSALASSDAGGLPEGTFITCDFDAPSVDVATNVEDACTYCVAKANALIISYDENGLASVDFVTKEAAIVRLASVYPVMTYQIKVKDDIPIRYENEHFYNRLLYHDDLE